MKTNSLVKLFIILCFSFFGCSLNPIKNIKDVIQSTRPYYLIQNYKIYGTGKGMRVEATVYEMQLSNAKEKQHRYPEKVEFNSSPMKNKKLSSEDDEADNKSPCDKFESKKGEPELVIGPVRAAETILNDSSDFSIVQNNFQTTNSFSVTGSDGLIQGFEVFFEPKKFADTEPIFLSRSKENVVQLKGTGDKKSTFLLTSGHGDGIDEKSIIYDSSKNTLTISGKSLKEIKYDYATFLIQSSDWQPIKTIGIATGNYYSIYFKDERCVQIVK
jgi:hypothetical protein